MSSSQNRLLPPDDHEEGDPWLMTFADMVSLLFAFFVILYSMSAVNISKYEGIRDSLHLSFTGKATAGKPITGKALKMEDLMGLPKGAPKKAESLKSLNDKVNAELVAITSKMNAFIQTHKLGTKVSTFIDDRGVVIKIADDILFAPGEAHLSKESQLLINYLVELIQQFPYQLRVEGHTDNSPIHTAAYPTNWELSTARACNVVRVFIEKGANPALFSAEGFAEYRPIGNNTTPSGKMKNRRVELIYKKDSILQAIKNGNASTPNSTRISATAP